MATLTITKNYTQGTVLTEAQLDAIRTSLQTFANTTLFSSSNIDCDSIGSGMSSIGANAVASALNSTGAAQVFGNISATEGQMLQVQNSGTAAVQTTEAQAQTTESTLSGVSGLSDWADLANGTLTVTARNRPLLFTLQSYDTTTSALKGEFKIGASGNASIRLMRDSTALAKYGFNRTAITDVGMSIGSVRFLDLNPGIGSKVYKLQYFADASANLFWNFKLVVVEL